MSSANMSAIQGMTKDELVSAYARAKNYLATFKARAQAPMEQGALTLSGWGGGILSGVLRVYLPEVWGVPVDGALGVVISLASLMGAGEAKMWDASAVFGVGLAAPALSRGTENLLKQYTEKK
jgi:hypothetical protein